MGLISTVRLLGGGVRRSRRLGLSGEGSLPKSVLPNRSAPGPASAELVLLEETHQMSVDFLELFVTEIPRPKVTAVVRRQCAGSASTRESASPRKCSGINCCVIALMNHAALRCSWLRLACCLRRRRGPGSPGGRLLAKSSDASHLAQPRKAPLDLPLRCCGSPFRISSW